MFFRFARPGQEGDNALFENIDTLDSYAFVLARNSRDAEDLVQETTFARCRPWSGCEPAVM